MIVVAVINEATSCPARPGCQPVNGVCGAALMGKFFPGLPFCGAACGCPTAFAVSEPPGCADIGCIGRATTRNTAAVRHRTVAGSGALQKNPPHALPGGPSSRRMVVCWPMFGTPEKLEHHSGPLVVEARPPKQDLAGVGEPALLVHSNNAAVGGQ